MHIRDRGHAPWAFALAAAVVCSAAPVAAEVALDGTANPAFRGALAGPDYRIGAELGRTEGGNLFHSFERFGLRTGESATFSGPGGIDNVISRVTGGAPSSIDGALRSTIPGADFFFLNPAGVVFGPNATLDVPGSFHVSTADELRFADGATYSATDPGASSFTMAPPEAFGFLGAEPGDLTVDRSRLSVPAGEALSLVGGDVTITAGNNGLDSGGEDGTVRAEAGRITLAALGRPGSASVADGGITAAAFADIRLTDQALVDASGDGGGAVRIRGGQLVVENQSRVSANNTGPMPARGGTTIDADAVMVGNASAVTANVFGSGAGGGVALDVGRLELRDGAQVTASTFGPGAGGDITVEAEEVVAAGAGGGFQSGLFANSQGTGSEAGAGAGGGVALDVGRLELRDGAQVTASTFGPGAGGDITVEAEEVVAAGAGGGRQSGLFADSQGTDPGSGAGGGVALDVGRLELSDGAQVGVTTHGPGDAGAVTVTVTGEATIKDGGKINSSSLGFFGRPGDIRLDVGSLVLENGGVIGSVSLGPISSPEDVEGGDIAVTARSEIMISGRADDDGTGITAATTGARNAGSVLIQAPILRMPQEALIDSSTLGDGDAGPVTVEVGRLTIGPEAFISSVSVSPDLSMPDLQGAAGRVRVVATEAIQIADGGILTSTATAGPAGFIEVRTPFLRIADGGQIQSATVGGSGRSGTVDIDATTVEIIGGGYVTTASTGIGEDAGEAGGITVEATDTLRMSGDGRISAETARANAGDIEIRAGRLVDLEDSEVTTSAAVGEGGGGNIFIDSEFVILDGSRIVAQAEEGAGGNIEIQADHLFQTPPPDSVIDASSKLGIDGDVMVDAPDIDVTSGLVALPGDFVDASSLLRESCAAGRSEAASSFIGVGRGGVAPGPEDLLAGFYAGLIDARTGTITAAEAMPRFEPVGLVMACGGED